MITVNSLHRLKPRQPLDLIQTRLCAGDPQNLRPVSYTHLARQQRLEKIITDQFQEQDKNNELMISILSHIVEFRNGESGLHVLHVNTITKFLLEMCIRDRLL